MTYDNTSAKRGLLQNASISCLYLSTLLALVLLTTLPSQSLKAAALTYDSAGGRLTGFDTYHLDNPNQPNPYKNSTEYYTNHGFVGRLIYVGEPTTFTNTGKKIAMDIMLLRANFTGITRTTAQNTVNTFWSYVPRDSPATKRSPPHRGILTCIASTL